MSAGPGARGRPVPEGAEGQAGRLFGAVLAGGASRRFGTDKARAEIAGRSMVERALDALAPGVDARGMVLGAEARPGAPDRPRDVRGGGSRDGQAGAPGRTEIPLRRDARPGLGPLEGLRVALEWAREEGCDGLVVLACDLPLVDASVVGALVRAWRARGADAPDGVVPVVEGRAQPLAAVYSTEIAGTVTRRLEGGRRSVTGMLDELRVARIPAGSPGLPAERFLNVNTPAEAREAGAFLASGPGGEIGPGAGPR